MKAIPLGTALLALSVPTAALANVRATDPAPKETSAVSVVQEAKEALDELEAAFAKMRPATNTRFTQNKIQPPAAQKPGMPAAQPLYGGFVGPKPQPVTHPTPPAQPLYGVFEGPTKPQPVTHPTPPAQPLYGVFEGPTKPQPVTHPTPPAGPLYGVFIGPSKPAPKAPSAPTQPPSTSQK